MSDVAMAAGHQLLALLLRFPPPPPEGGLAIHEDARGLTVASSRTPPARAV